jgi:hypothetical protein
VKRLVVTALCSTARADPPAPLVMPELEPRSEVKSTLVVGNSFVDPATNDTLIDLSIEPRLKLEDHIETFADVAVFHMHMVDDDYGHDGYSGVRDVRLGARGVINATGALTLGAGVWSYLPTAMTGRHQNDWIASREEADLLRGSPDPYALSDGFALGGALDARWSDGTTFVQGELGATIVRDLGHLEVDDALAALGAGGSLRGAWSWLAELRLVQEPIGAHFSSDRFWTLMFGAANACMLLRGRFGVGLAADGNASPAFLVGVDGTLRR